MEITRVEQRAYIKIAVLRGRNATECHSELVEALGNNALPYRTVARWVGKFQQAHVSTSDEQRSRRPVSVRKNWSIHRTLPAFRPVTLILFPRLRNQYVVGGLQHERTLLMLCANRKVYFSCEPVKGLTSIIGIVGCPRKFATQGDSLSDRQTDRVLIKSLVYETPGLFVERNAIISLATERIGDMPGIFQNVKNSVQRDCQTYQMTSDSDYENGMNNAVLVPTSSEMRNIMKSVVTTVLAVSMIRGPQAIGAPACVTTVPLTGLPYLKKGPEGILMAARIFGQTKIWAGVSSEYKQSSQFLDEAHFWLNGYVNKQNCRIWSEANPQVYVETPLHPEKLTVWCSLWAGEILLQKR
ncbi:HTH_48 domain-containing protein [Trichonephila clavipes]|nr:HTH_48 domain-containing protein [Trichonephila clavipes]